MAEVIETWKPIDGIDFYEVSSLGNVRSTNREIETVSRWGKPMKKSLKGKQLKPFCVGAGYLCVMFTLKGKKHYVHRLVAKTFLGDKSNLDVNHIDGNKTNNAVSNLEWVTRSENCLHSTHVLKNTKGQFGKGRIRL